jgi:hypothetical protein
MTELPDNTPPAAAPADTGPSPEILKSAFNAFKKRLKIMQLDNDSQIGRSPMSGGQRSMITGITPPDQFPREVWEALVKQGKLKNVGHGLYTRA